MGARAKIPKTWNRLSGENLNLVEPKNFVPFRVLLELWGLDKRLLSKNNINTFLFLFIYLSNPFYTYLVFFIF